MAGFAEAVEKIASGIEQNSKSWSIRLNHLKSLQELIYTHENNPSKWQADTLSRLSAPLASQVQDLRSTIVREACKAIQLFAKIVGDYSRPIAKVLLPVLIDQIGCGNKVIIGYVSECGNCVMTHTRVRSVIPKMAQYMQTNRHKLVKERCMGWILIALLIWSSNDLRRHTDVLQRALKAGLQDASGETRTIARKCFHAFSDKFPEQAKSVLRFIDPRTQRLLLDHMHASSSDESGSSTGSRGDRHASPSPPPSPLSSRSSGHGGSGSSGLSPASPQRWGSRGGDLEISIPSGGSEARSPQFSPIYAHVASPTTSSGPSPPHPRHAAAQRIPAHRDQHNGNGSRQWAGQQRCASDSSTGSTGRGNGAASTNGRSDHQRQQQRQQKPPRSPTLRRHAPSSHRAAAPDTVQSPPSSPREAHVTLGEPVLVSTRFGDSIGAVRFCGKSVQFADGEWIGVEFDEAVGKNDGSVQGIPYFRCAPNHGLFVRPSQMKPYFKRTPAPAPAPAPPVPPAPAATSTRRQLTVRPVLDGRQLSGGSDQRRRCLPPSTSTYKTSTTTTAEWEHSAADETQGSGNAAGGRTMRELGQDLLAAHRAHIDSVLEALKLEMEELAEFENEVTQPKHNLTMPSLRAYTDAVTQRLGQRLMMQKLLEQNITDFRLSLKKR